MTTVHVYPEGDAIEHDTDDDDCLCGPDIEAVPRADGGIGWLVTHHSLDGRELRETIVDAPLTHSCPVCERPWSSSRAAEDCCDPKWDDILDRGRE